MVISEARLSSTVTLAAIPVIMATAVVISVLRGSGWEDSMYFRAFGPVVPIVFFGGSAYAFYEFAKVVRGRSRYFTYSDGYLHILAHRPIRLDNIQSIAIERNLLLRNLVIRTAEGKTTRIRGYMLGRDLNEVKRSIEMLQEPEST